MDAATRDALIDRLDRSFQAMPDWQQSNTRNDLVVDYELPTRNPQTGEQLKSFREVAGYAANDDLERLRDNFKEEGYLAAEKLHYTVPTREEIANERFERHLEAAVEYAKYEITGDVTSLTTALHNAEVAGVNREEKSKLLINTPELAEAFDRGLARNGLPEKYTMTYATKAKVEVYHDADSAAKAFVRADHKDRPQVIGEVMGSSQANLLAYTEVKESARSTDYNKVMPPMQFATKFSGALWAEGMRNKDDPSKALAVTIPTKESSKERTFER
ncbi:hypothetical protein [Pseudomonas syringae group genomosp. 3]|uniref:hypothetical protein n=1 Tax=Pseudomonas syringae group genomosp. 3 TaxID=251701 RepID=UPI0006B8B650|nr:hypothetical protein [Pseudomonas syringae group genomosp. 3]KPB82022.1 Uncharacterized protein AC505_0337 [Pseudomonas syringae pv. maculicola]